MTKAKMEQEIAVLESRLAEATAARPAHDTTGAHQAMILEIEDELAERRRALGALPADNGMDQVSSTDRSAESRKDGHRQSH